MTFPGNSYDFLFDVKEALGADLIEQVFLPVPRWFSGTDREGIVGLYLLEKSLCISRRAWCTYKDIYALK